MLEKRQYLPQYLSDYGFKGTVVNHYNLGCKEHYWNIHTGTRVQWLEKGEPKRN